MPRATSQYFCQECGTSYAKWAGRCEACNSWNSLVEEAPVEAPPKGLGAKRGRKIEFADMSGGSKEAARRITGIGEFDRVCGGGLVPGSALLVGGDPGIGKSTILLQAVAALAGEVRCAYISGEESIDQLRLRAARLGVDGAPVKLSSASSVRDIAASLEDSGSPQVVIVDSIQTMYVDSLESAPGTVSQVRASAQELIRMAKRRGFTVILVGHVTKDGQIAGPRVMEHMVDTVLYFEGERSHQFRILRAVKNRFGPTDEIGVFEMTDGGLMEVSNPSALFLSERQGDVSGAAVFAGIEGTRPMLLEIQSLIAPSSLASPRRAVVGWDAGRLSMILAVLESRCGLTLSGYDIYLNVAGGLRVGEPAADLAVAAAVASASSGVPVPPETVIFGEVGLSGEIRAVSHTDLRIKEATKLGFARAITPKRRSRGDRRRGAAGSVGLEIDEISHLQELLSVLRAPARQPLEKSRGDELNKDALSGQSECHG